MTIESLPAIRTRRPAMNKGRIVGQKHTFRPKHFFWAIRIQLEIANSVRDLAPFNLAIHSEAVEI